MNNDDIRKELEAEKLALAAFLKMAKKFKLPSDEIEKQVNFYLEKINELLKKSGN